MLRKAENLQERAKEAVDVAKAEDEMLGENAGIFTVHRLFRVF